MAQHVGKPAIGDHVAVIGRNGVFEITLVNEHVRTVDLKLIPTDELVTRVPWMALSYGTAENQKS